jgi:hypothetical protein
VAPDVTTGRVVVVVGTGWVVVVVGADVVGGVVGGEPDVGVVGDAVEGVEVAGADGIVVVVVDGVRGVDWTGPVALAPGCSLATTTAIAAVAPVATNVMTRVRRRTRACARRRDWGE